MGPNLSDWALKHRSFVIFLMIAATIAGLGSYASLGRNEDPAFTFRAMVVFAAWPGATLEDTVEQVTERIERTLQVNADKAEKRHEKMDEKLDRLIERSMAR